MWVQINGGTKKIVTAHRKCTWVGLVCGWCKRPRDDERVMTPVPPAVPSNDGVKQSKNKVKTSKGSSGCHVYSCKFFNFFLGAISHGRSTIGCPMGSKMSYGCQKQKKNMVGCHLYKFLGGIGKNPPPIESDQRIFDVRQRHE